MKKILNKKILIISSIILFIIICISIYIITNRYKIPVLLQQEKDTKEIETTSSNELLGTITIEKIDLINAPTSEGSYFARLKELQNGDIIIYKNITGEHKYIINEIKEIEDTNTEVIENTIEEKITLITCVENKPSKRLCITGILEGEL